MKYEMKKRKLLASAFFIANNGFLSVSFMKKFSIFVLSLSILTPSTSYEIDWPGEVASVVNAFEDAILPEERSEAIRDCAFLDAENAIPLLEEALEDEDALVRIAALEVIGDNGLISFSRSVQAALSDPIPSVRAQAATCLGALRPAHAADQISRVLLDPNEDVRMAAIHALAQTGDPSAIIAITSTFHDRSQELVINALEILGDLGDANSSYAVIELLQHPNQNIVLAAIDALVALQAQDAVSGLLQLTQARAEVALRATEALGELHAIDAIHVLTQLVLSPNVQSQEVVAMAALATIADPSALLPLAHFIASQPEEASDLLIATAPQSWPLIERAYIASGNDENQMLALLRIWLLSGDPKALEELSKFSDILSGPNYIDYLRMSSTQTAYCNMLDLYSPTETTEEREIIEIIQNGVTLDALSCAESLFDSLSHFELQHRLELISIIAPADPALALILANELEFERLNSREVAQLIEGLSSSEESAPIVARLLNHPNEQARREASFSLTQLNGDWITEEYLDSHLENAETAKAVSALWNSDRWELGAQFVERLLSTNSPDLHVEAISLSSYHCDLPRNINTFFSQQDYWLRRSAAMYAAHCASENVDWSLLSGDQDPVIRSLALDQLEENQNQRIEIASSRSASPFERARAIRTLSFEENAELLTELTHDPNPLIVAAAWSQRLLLINNDPLSQEAELAVFAAYANASPLVRAAIYLGVINQNKRELLTHGMRIENESPAFDILHSDLQTNDETTWVFLTNSSETPHVDATLFVAFIDGSFDVFRSDHEGRILIQDPIAFVSIIDE